ncbi:MAG: alpha/beta fold hydrolase, partial [Spongiibacteraceae bacterium]
MTATVANTIDIPHITRAEIAARGKTPLEQLEMLRDLYALSGADDIDDKKLEQWTAKPNVFDKLRPLVALQAKMTRKQILIDGNEINYWEGGNPSKQTLLLIHGFGACKENWGLLTRYLRDDYHLLIPDVPGFGESTFHFGCDYALTAQADRLLQWLKQTNRGPVYAIGNSMGGAIAAQMAAKMPDQVSRLCLMNAAGAPGSRMTLLELGLH